MELALPIIALGGLYVISNQSNKDSIVSSKKRENFANLNQNKKLPNADTPIQNYPVVNQRQLSNNINEYVNPNVATDKYFNQSYYEKKVVEGKNVGNEPPQIYSLTGEYVDNKTFNHNNMVPFVGGKPRSYTYKNDMAENILDTMSGSGSQHIKKVEQAPLFKPEDSVNYIHGAPNHSDFFQSRVTPGLISNNVKPFESIQVGPGLNHGFSTQGSNGFNSGMESRDLWLPKTVDELRVDTNPKLEYNLLNHEGPAGSQVKNLGLIGRVEKQKPDKFFMNTQDRWFTTTGAEKGETQRPTQEMGIIRRNNPLLNYTGPAGKQGQSVGYTPSEYEQSKRIELKKLDVSHSNAIGRGPMTDGENYLKSHTNYENNRSTITQPETIRSSFGGAIGAVIAPLMDILKPSRKEEYVNNIRVYGEGAKTKVSSNYVLNPKDITNTTIKETTMYSPKFNINNQKEGVYVNNYVQPDSTIKETTMYSPNFYINNQKEGVYVNNYVQPDSTQRDSTSCENIGNIGGGANQHGTMMYDSAYGQHNNEIKSQTIHNRPNQGGTQVFNQQMNVSTFKPDTNCHNNRLFTPSSVIKMSPMKENYGEMQGHQLYDNDKIGTDRIQGDLLQAFRNNPYTHSLTSSV